MVVAIFEFIFNIIRLKIMLNYQDSMISVKQLKYLPVVDKNSKILKLVMCSIYGYTNE